MGDLKLYINESEISFVNGNEHSDVLELLMISPQSRLRIECSGKMDSYDAFLFLPSNNFYHSNLMNNKVNKILNEPYLTSKEKEERIAIETKKTADELFVAKLISISKNEFLFPINTRKRIPLDCIVVLGYFENQDLHLVTHRFRLKLI